MSRYRTAALAVALSTVALSAGLVAGSTSATAATDRIVFDDGNHIWIMDGSGTNKADLMTGWTGGTAVDPTLSPNGSTVAFVWWPFVGGPAAHEIYAIPSTPTLQANAVQLTNNSVSDSDPAWSADGSKLAFVRVLSTVDGPVGQIFTMAANGSGAAKVTTTADGGSNPTWSPDGSKIAYTSSADHYGCVDPIDSSYFIGFSQIHSVSSAGGGDVSLIQRPTLTAGNPDWSPDSTQITFYGDEYTLGTDVGNGPTCLDSTGNHVYSMPASGSPNPSPLHPGIWPAWSPDGTQIAYSDDATQGIFVMDANGSNAVSLSATGRFVDWVLPGMSKTATTTTMSITSGLKLKATGSVSPNLAGQPVKVVLSRKSGGVFSKVASKAPALSVSSTYVASFAHPASGTCRIKTTYAGDATHLASSKSQTVAC